ncbi:MAG TPA: fatty acid desaturase [Isosphaeraceae bacterium]|nr:fatty acid desaturase [Isosphaeraceae bacterium]
MRGTESTGDLTWKEAYHQVVPLMRVDNRKNIRYILLEYSAMVLVLGICSWSWFAFQQGRLTGLGFFPIALAGMFAMGALQHRLSGLAHDASHYTLFRNKLANELASDILLMFPIFAMTQKFRNSHLGHHRFVNDPVMDPDVVRLNAPEPQRFPVSPRGFVFRYVVKALWPPSLLRYLFGQAKGANARVSGGVQDVRAPYRFRVGRVMRGTYWLSVLTMVHALHAWPIFFLFWVTPLLTFYPMLMQLREIAHHSNAPDDGRFTNSRVFFVNPILDACVFPYGQAFHVTHHLFAMLPHHQMLNAHRALMRFPAYRDQVVICRGFFFRTPGTNGPSVVEELARTPRPGDLLWDGPPSHRQEVQEPAIAAV